MISQFESSTLFYKVRGQGMPIIILHGWSFDHQHMVSALEPCFQMREQWQRIYLDMPGHGQSSGIDGINNMNDVLEKILQFIDHVFPDRRFVLAGMSAGGYLARGVVMRKSTFIDGVLLFVPRMLANDAQRVLPPKVTLIENPELLAELPPNEAEMMQDAVVQSQQVVNSMRSDIFPAWEKTDWELLQNL